MRHRIVAIVAVFMLGFVSALAPLVSAQTAAERFAETIDNRDRLPVLSGPYEFELAQAPGVLSVFRAGIDVPDFVAHAVFVNPEADDGVPWDYGFQFRTTGDNEDFRIFAVSTGTWNFSIGTDPPDQTVAAPNLKTEPGERNTIDLIVEGFEATIGINGEFAATILLPDLTPSGDVYASTGFFSDLVVPGRAIGLQEFTVYGPPGSEGQAAGAFGGIPPARPATLYRGSCAEFGEAASTLNDVTFPNGKERGQASAVVAQTSFTRVPFLLDELVDEPFAINVAASADEPNLSIVCGDIGGVFDELGAYVIELTERNGSGYRGIAYIAPDPQTGRSSISIFLAPPVDVPVPAASATPAVASTNGGEDAAATEAAAGATPVSVITIEVEDLATPNAGAGTPVP
ncbi:MAG: hypothetical protein U0031_20165 [Thermomicrobiales bacterium]